MILDGALLIVFGGFNGSHHFDDTWYFNVGTRRWLQKKAVVYPLWPGAARHLFGPSARAEGCENRSR